MGGTEWGVDVTRRRGDDGRRGAVSGAPDRAAPGAERRRSCAAMTARAYPSNPRLSRRGHRSTASARPTSADPFDVAVPAAP